MSGLFNGDYDVFLYMNDFNRVVKHNFLFFDNALYVLLYWLCRNDNFIFYKPVIPIKITKNGRLVARAATYTGVENVF